MLSPQSDSVPLWGSYSAYKQCSGACQTFDTNHPPSFFMLWHTVCTVLRLDSSLSISLYCKLRYTSWFSPLHSSMNDFRQWWHFLARLFKWFRIPSSFSSLCLAFLASLSRINISKALFFSWRFMATEWLWRSYMKDVNIVGVGINNAMLAYDIIWVGHCWNVSCLCS